VATLAVSTHLPRPCDHDFFHHPCVPNRVTTLWVFVIFGEYQVIAQLIAKRVLLAPLIHKDFPVRHPLLAHGNFASVTLNHQK
jgi:hypothetical protein